MKIYANQLLINLSKMGNYKKFLLFGPDEGNISFSLEEIIKALKQHTEYTVRLVGYKDCKNGFHIIKEELLDVSLFGDKKIIVLNDIPANAGKELTDFFSNLKANNTLILVAGDVKPSSTLRKQLENREDTFSIACYKDDQRDITKFIEAELRLKKINYSNGIPEALGEHLPHAKILVRSEIERIAIYLDGTKLDFENLEELIYDISEASFDNIFYWVIKGDADVLTHNLHKSFIQGFNFMLPLRTAIRQFAKLLEIFESAKSLNISPKEALEKTSPPIFFKIKPLFEQSLANTSLAVVQQYIKELVELELKCKTCNLDQELLVTDTFIKLCKQVA